MIEWKKSKNGLMVPIIEGKALSSLVDPHRESASWVKNILMELDDTTEQIFVLGVGGGFHIEKLREATNIEIVCIDLQEEFVLSKKNTDITKYVLISDSMNLWEELSNQQISGRKYAIAIHYPSIQYAKTRYFQIRDELNLRSPGSVYRYEKNVNIIPSLININVPEDSHLDVKKLSEEQKNIKHHKNYYMWKIIGDFIK